MHSDPIEHMLPIGCFQDMESAPLQAIHQSATHCFIIVSHENRWIVDMVCSRRSAVWKIDRLTAPATLLSNGIFWRHLVPPDEPSPLTCRTMPTFLNQFANLF
jgi:hypothetical protein